MIDVPVTISAGLSVRLSDLPSGAADGIRSYLSIANDDKARSVKRGDWGADDLPDYFQLWSEVDGRLLMPRGFASVLRDGLERQGARVRWVDETSSPSVSLREAAACSVPVMRPEQERAVQAILSHRQGVLWGPTAMGKTVTALECWRRAGVTGLVLVGRQQLARQWQDRAREHIGVEAGIIGDGTWDERSLTIAMVQTLYSRRHSLDRDWWSRWGSTWIDECHHAVAPSWTEVVCRLPSSVIVGMTATPHEGDWMQEFLVRLIGPIVHHVTDAEVRESTMAPVVRVVPTEFRWAPDRRQARLRDPRAIYRHVVESLVADERRNRLIARTIAGQPPQSTQLVLSKRLSQLGYIRTELERVGYPGAILEMRGSESEDERAAVLERAEDGGCVILSTLADEGTDIPRLDRLHLPWPQRKALTITQQAGRVSRRHPLKLDPVVLDYVDPGNELLYAQFKARQRDVYRKRGWLVEHPERSLT